MKQESAARLVAIGLLVALAFAFCCSVSLAQVITLIKNKETLAPSGTLRISGNLEMLPLATTTCNVTPTSCDNVNVWGVGMLDGRLIVNMTGSFTHSTRRTLLQANGGLMAGRFSLVKINCPTDQDWKARITYDAKHVYLEIASASEDFPAPLPAQPAPEIKPSTPAVSDEQASRTVFRPTVAGLTFAKRVAYQYAIEAVYWRHRIWPKDNTRPKPLLNAVVRRSQLEKKVEDYLRKAKAVEDKRGWAINTSELQAEMDRMAKHTHQSETLRELFAALGNDPFVIAECLARPIVAEQLLAGLTIMEGAWSAPRSLPAADTVASTVSMSTYRVPEILDDCSDDTWTATTTLSAPDARWGHTAIWTGSEMIVWGGSFTDNVYHYFNTGGRYDPATDTWSATSTTNAPTARWRHSAVWTGNEIIVWGGYGGEDEFFNSGGRYNPADDSWTAMSTANAPTARISASAVWTGSEMIVWGGYNYTNGRFNSGGRYSPATDTWIPTNTINAPEARWYHTAEWTGNEMILWGGTNETIYLNTGGKYNPSADNWTATGVPSDVLGRAGHSAVWTGDEMIVWGGVDSTFSDCNTGGRYNPSTDSWMTTSIANAPSPRDSHSAVWTGTEMIVWGGIFCFPCVDFDTGGRYDPGTDSWVPTSVAKVPFARENHTAIWTGSEMMVWGGYNYTHNLFFNTGGRYCAQSGATPTPTPTTTASATAAPTATATATATPTATASATPTGAPSATPTTTPAPTARPTPTPRPNLTPRPRPTPPPRP